MKQNNQTVVSISVTLKTVWRQISYQIQKHDACAQTPFFNIVVLKMSRFAHISSVWTPISCHVIATLRLKSQPSSLDVQHSHHQRQCLWVVLTQQGPGWLKLKEVLQLFGKNEKMFCSTEKKMWRSIKATKKGRREKKMPPDEVSEVRLLLCVPESHSDLRLFLDSALQ